MNLYAVIMAGGVGARFWPRSKMKTPKQLLKIFGENTMIQDTVKRIEPLVKKDNIYIITNRVQQEGIEAQLPDIPKENIIYEPFGRNTAACIGLASILIHTKDSEAVTFILPSDHIIPEEDLFRQTLINAADFAFNSKGLVTIGVTPTKPETGYGYIQIDEKQVKDHIFKVLTFAEKPNFSTAVRFLESGDFLWNSGMFIWRADSIIEEIKNYLPDLSSGLNHIKTEIGKPTYDETLTNIYGQLKKISIDYGVMEKSKNVYLVKGNFSWSDVGSWDAVYQLSEKDSDGNVKVGHVYTDMSVDSYVYSPDNFTALIGVDNIIVINTEGAVLICKREKSQDVKNVIDYLKFNKLDDYL
jgi:mannose-1-phosphate guanylyltransferase